MHGFKLFVFTLFAGVLLFGQDAAATCWQVRDGEGVPVQRCCQAQGAPASCTRVSQAQREQFRRERAARRLEAERLRRERQRREEERRKRLERWRDAQKKRWRHSGHGVGDYRRSSRPRRPVGKRARPQAVGWDRGPALELGIAFGGRVTTGSSKSVGRDTAGAAATSLGLALRYRAHYNAESFAGRGWEAIPIVMVTFGLAALPKSAWLGNDFGIELYGEVAYRDAVLDNGSSVAYALRVVPALRVASPRSRLRWPSLLGVFVPMVGVQWVDDRPAQLMLSIWRIPLAVKLDARSAIEVALAAVAIRVPDSPITWRVGGLIELRALVF